MSQSITVELQFFAISILWGALVLLAYDQLRVLRRIIRHNNFWITVQDLIFWIIASVFIFAMIYVKNSGTIRGFCVMGMVIGMVIYHYVLSDFIVMVLSRGVLLLLYPFSYFLKILKKGLKLLTKKAGIHINRIFQQLKNLVKSVKIKLIRNRQKKQDEKISKKKKKTKNKVKKNSKKNLQKEHKKSDEKKMPKHLD